MPESTRPRSQSTKSDSYLHVIEAAQTELAQEFEKALTNAMKQHGFAATLKSLNKKLSQTGGMATVLGGVMETLPSGTIDAALHTDKGPVVIHGTEHANRESTDPQFVSSERTPSHDTSGDFEELTTDQLLDQLRDAGSDVPGRLICAIELQRFDSSQRETLLPLLWRYILEHRDSNVPQKLVSVGSAIRKYIALMPMDRMGDLVVLLEPGHRSPLPIELEIEVAKMVFRNFEVHPPAVEDPHPELAKQFWELVQAYTNPRVLLRSKHSAAASLAIAAIVSMRSPLAVSACETATTCPYHWFAELVDDDLDGLHESWNNKHADAAAWLRELRRGVLAQV